MVLLLGFTLLASAELHWVVNRPVVNMYSRPSGDVDVVSQSIFGTNVTVMEQRKGWVRIQTPDAYSGWLPASQLLALAAPYPASKPALRVESLFAHLYAEADVTRRRPLLTLPFESQLEVTTEPESDGRRWLGVRLPDGRSAWIQRGDVSFGEPPAARENLADYSKRFLGLPYTWGGASSFGYDCSGFTQMLGRRLGLRLPRDSGPQASWEGAVAVEKNDLQPGDFLFFGASSTNITHTGFYLGGGEFIHATTHERPVVQISRIDDPHWAKLLVTCRRPK